MISWLNMNSGAVMALLTLVYVVATILICFFNYKAADASRKQTEESQRQFVESNRARVIPRFDVIEGELYCLVFQNTGHSLAEDLNIVVSDEWLSRLSNTQKCSSTAVTLKGLSETTIFLPEGDKYFYALCVPADGTGDFNLLCEVPFKVALTYKSNGKIYTENFTLPLRGVNCLVNTSDYVRIEKKKLQQMRDTNKELSKLRASINGKQSVTNPDTDIEV